MQTRLDILKYFSTKKAAHQDASYSATMREMRQQQPEKVMAFMKSFKEAFDAAISDEMENAEKIALMQALKSI